MGGIGSATVRLSPLDIRELPAVAIGSGPRSRTPVLRSLRSAKILTPILILSGLVGIEDKIRDLGLGADDYLPKPFHKDELIARIHALVRRSKGHADSVIATRRSYRQP